MTKMFSLEGVTLIYSSPDKINVTQAWHCRCHITNMSRGPNDWYAAEKLRLHHVKPVQTTASSPADDPHGPTYWNLSVARCAHTCRQTCGTQSVKPFWSRCEKLDCLSLFPLCLCALRCFPLSQFHELLCCSQKHERQRPEDEARGRTKEKYSHVR